MGMGLAGCGDDLVHGGFRLPIRDVFADRDAEEQRILKDYSDFPAQRSAVIVRGIDSINSNGATEGSVEAEDQAGDGGFAGA